MRKLCALLALPLLTACFPQAFVSVKNDCDGVYFRISRIQLGERDVIAEKLMLGHRVDIDFTGVSGQENKFIVAADAFRESDGKPIGTADLNLYVYAAPGDMTSPRENHDWPISYVYPGGCPGRY